MQSSPVVDTTASSPTTVSSVPWTWLDERDAPRLPLSRADLHSEHEQTTADVVTQGGGVQAVIEATDLRTLDNVARMIDPVIVTRAFDNDLLEQTQPSPLALTRRPAIDAGETNGMSTEKRAELRRRARTDARLVV